MTSSTSRAARRSRSLQYLAAGVPVVIGNADVQRDLPTRTRRTGSSISSMPGEQSTGGHAVTVFAHDQNGLWFPQLLGRGVGLAGLGPALVGLVDGAQGGIDNISSAAATTDVQLEPAPRWCRTSAVWRDTGWYRLLRDSRRSWSLPVLMMGGVASACGGDDKAGSSASGGSSTGGASNGSTSSGGSSGSTSSGTSSSGGPDDAGRRTTAGSPCPSRPTTSITSSPPARASPSERRVARPLDGAAGR